MFQQVAREHVGESILCVDAVEGRVTENNKNKFGYVQAFVTGRFEGVAKEDYGVDYPGEIVQVRDRIRIDWIDLIKYLCKIEIIANVFN